ncbi:hypothetical protein HPP92_019763 [Vanilla planifolia]|uniref:Protein XRI1 n=1 Tax=Vanilla planifolia TaxID=51239 RepID=A0A835Q9L6_VANPL|nr:hypothetical protein HPP92_020220 [Vanilla planifolia]KAG0465599.1 hypothetical protein HPP92_019763 [Vanilla planifolia]
MFGQEGEEEDFFNLAALEVPDFLWDDINQSDFDLSQTIGEQTPVKECGEYFIDGLSNKEKNSRDLEEPRESSQAKRRRQLFMSDDNSLNKFKEKEQITSSSDNSLGEEQSENYFIQSQQQDNLSMSRFSTSRDLVDLTGSGWMQHKRQFSNPAQQTPTSASCKVFKGRKSYMKTPMKLTTSVAYPFSLIKPSGIQGEVTLNDINQFIQSPRASSSSNKMNEAPTLDYSPISGKPVVVKTKIHTEGGKGSITIMRTKG